MDGKEDNGKGIVAFTGSEYMFDSNYNILSTYIKDDNCPNCTDIYNSSLSSTAPTYNDITLISSEEYSIAYYVEPYRTTLDNLGVPINGIKLLTYKEIRDAGCTSSNLLPKCDFIYSTVYHLASISTENNMMCVVLDGGYQDGDIDCQSQGIDEAFKGGVRPLITVPTNTIPNI